VQCTRQYVVSIRPRAGRPSTQASIKQSHEQILIYRLRLGR
jgi:hypothetical protein